MQIAAPGSDAICIALIHGWLHFKHRVQLFRATIALHSSDEIGILAGIKGRNRKQVNSGTGYTVASPSRPS